MRCTPYQLQRHGINPASARDHLNKMLANFLEVLRLCVMSGRDSKLSGSDYTGQ